MPELRDRILELARKGYGRTNIRKLVDAKEWYIKETLRDARKSGELIVRPSNGHAIRVEDLKESLGIKAEDAGEEAPPKEDTTERYDIVERKDKGTLNISNCRIKLIEDYTKLLEYVQKEIIPKYLDELKYEIKSIRVGAWDVTIKDKDNKGVEYVNSNIRVDFAPRKESTELQALKQHMEELPGRLNLPKVKYKKGDVLAVLALYDPHFGKLAWDKETGESQKLSEISDAYVKASIELLDFSKKAYNLDRILIPLGQDFFHINDDQGMTPRGKNILHIDGRFTKIIQTGFDAVFEVIEYARRLAPIDIMWIPGNHDQVTSHQLCRELKSCYRSFKDVSVDVTPRERKAYVYGRNLIGLAHAHVLKPKDFVGLLVSEWREQMRETDFYECLVGHFHKKE